MYLRKWVKSNRNITPTPAWAKQDKQHSLSDPAQSSNHLQPDGSNEIYQGAQILPEWQQPSEGDNASCSSASEKANSDPEVRVYALLKAIANCSKDDAFTIESLKWDNLIEWINNHNIKPLAKQAMKKGMCVSTASLWHRLTPLADIIKAISSGPKQEEPTHEDIQELIHKVSHILFHSNTSWFSAQHEAKHTTAKAA